MSYWGNNKDTIFQHQIQKAREEYKETGIMTHERACILLNCSIAMKRFKEYGDLDEKAKEKGIKIIKMFEKKFGKFNYLSSNDIAILVYNLVGGLKYPLTDYHRERKIYKLFHEWSKENLEIYEIWRNVY